MLINRRKLLTMAALGCALPRSAMAKTPVEITWDDLIPPGVPYSEIVGEGIMDEASDFWRPVFDSNASKLNPVLDGAYVKLPGYIIPFDISAAGVNTFMLVPYAGACIHTPPPPANQLVFVTTKTPYPEENLWEPVWVIGHMRHELQSTEIADVGYSMVAEKMEIYEW